MRLYLKLALMIAVATAIQLSLPPAGRCAWEVQFAVRCWLAHQLQDAELEEQLVQEGQQRLREELRREFGIEPPVATASASAAGPAVSEPDRPPPPDQSHKRHGQQRIAAGPALANASSTDEDLQRIAAEPFGTAQYLPRMGWR